MRKRHYVIFHYVDGIISDELYVFDFEEPVLNKDLLNKIREYKKVFADYSYDFVEDYVDDVLNATAEALNGHWEYLCWPDVVDVNY